MWIFIAACCVLAYTGFCRLAHTSTDTRLPVRLAIWALTVAAIAAAMAVPVWAYAPGWPGAVLAVAMAAVQVVSSGLWRGGVPLGLQARQ